MDDKLLQFRNKMKKRRPKFIAQDSYKRMRLTERWRSPRGQHSKLRYNKRGNAKKVSPGFKSPVAVKGLSRQGLVINHVSTAVAMQKLQAKKDAIIIGSTVGKRKRLLLLAEAQKLGLKVLNVKDAAAYKTAIETAFASRKNAQKTKKVVKQEKQKEAEKKAEKKSIDKLAEEKEEGKADEKSAEEKKEEERKENEKLLMQ